MCTAKKLLLCAVLLLAVGLIEAWVFSQTDRGKYIKVLRVHLFLCLELVNGLSIWYIWRRLNTIIKTNSIIAVGFIFKVAVLCVLVLSMVTMVVVILPVSSDPHILAFLSSFCLGSVGFLTTCLWMTDLTSFIIRRLSRLRDNTKTSRPQMKDKTEIKIRTYLALAGALGLILFGTLGVSKITVERIRVPIKHLDHSLNGTKVVQLSDIHLGPFTGKTALEGIVKKVNSLSPDIVVITGDLTDASFESLREAASPLKDIVSKRGVYYVTGNHEYYTGDVDGWLGSIHEFGVTALANERVCLGGSHDPHSMSCDRGLYIAGLEDIEARKQRYAPHSMDLHSALSGRQEGVPTIVLAHQPWAAVEAIMWKDVRLVLSGHTHGGQIFPMAPLVYLYNPFFCGLYEPKSNVYVYVNPGSYYYMLPFRHYYNPEITEFTLIAS